jgi:hypothetical protein
MGPRLAADFGAGRSSHPATMLTWALRDSRKSTGCTTLSSLLHSTSGEHPVWKVNRHNGAMIPMSSVCGTLTQNQG